MAVDQGLTDARQVLAQPYPINSVKFALESWKFLRNFWRNIPTKFSGIFGSKIPEKILGISWDYVSYSVPLELVTKS